MRRVAIGILVSAAVLSTSALQAHEGHVHKLMGTVTAVRADANEVELKTTDGKTATFYVTAETKFLKGSKPGALADLSPGTRVVVTTRMKDDKSFAAEVRIGVATPATPAAPHPH